MRVSMTTAVFVVAITSSGLAWAESGSDSTLTVETTLSFWSGIRKEVYVDGADQPLYRLGNFPSRAPGALLERRSPDAAELYMKFRSKQITSSVLAIAGLATYCVLFVREMQSFWEPSDERVPLLITGLTLTSAALVIRIIGWGNLGESVKLYNKTFAESQE